MGRRSYLRVRCPTCGEVGTLTYRRGLGFYVNHGRRTSHRVRGYEAVEVVTEGDRVALIRYAGGDYWLLPHIYKMFAPHTCYVEVFGGGAPVLLNKPPSKVEVYNDIDGNLYNLFKVVKERPNELLQKLDLVLYSRQTFYELHSRLAKGVEDDVERAAVYYYIVRSSMFGRMGSGFGTSKAKNHASDFFNALEDVRRIHKRLRNVVVENLDFRECIKRYDSKTTFFYLDPPHLYTATEKGSDYYVHGFTERDYMDLLSLLEKVEGRFLLKQTAHTGFVVDWAKEHGYSVRVVELAKSMDKKVGERRETYRVWFIANYRL